MRNSIFFDTSDWASLYIPTENYHAQAVKVFQQSRQQQRSIVTTNYVLTELVALLYSPLRTPRPRIFEVIDAIKTAPFVQLIHITPEVDTLAWELCKARPDKSWSLVDCTSFVIMQQQGVQEALTTDHHFEQAGLSGSSNNPPSSATGNWWSEIVCGDTATHNFRPRRSNALSSYETASIAASNAIAT